jgi:hypothetical protein
MTSDDCCKIKKWEKIPGEISRTDCPRFIKKIDDCSSFYLNSQKNILIQNHQYLTNNSCEVKHFNLYCMKTEKLLGSFEFNTDEEDLCFLDLEDIRKVN